MIWMSKFNVKWNTFNQNIKHAFTANILSQIGLGIFMVIYNFYIRELGYPDQINGQVVSMAAMATAIILIPAGILSDRVGRKQIILAGMALTGLSLFFRSVIEPQFFLLLAAFMTGLTQAFIQVSTIPLLAENSQPKERVGLFALHFGTMTAANVIGNLMGGTLTDAFGLIYSPLMSIRITLIIGSAIFLFALVPVWKIKEKKQETAIGAAIKKARLFHDLLKHKSSLKIMGLFGLAQLMIGFGAGLVIPYLNLYFSDRFQASNTSIGLIISLGQAATAIAMFIGPAVVRRIGEVRAVVLLQLASLPFLLLTGFTSSLLLAAIGFLFRQALMNAGNPIQMSLMMSKVDDSVKGLANSVNQMAFNLGWALMGPVSMGIVAANGAYRGYAIVFSITCFLYLCGSIYFFAVFKSLDKERKTKEPALG